MKCSEFVRFISVLSREIADDLKTMKDLIGVTIIIRLIIEYVLSVIGLIKVGWGETI